MKNSLPTDLSRQLGECDNYLAVFKFYNKHLPDTSPIGLYKHIIKRRERQESAIMAMQNIVYEVEVGRGIHRFGMYLKSKGYYTKAETLYEVFKTIFNTKCSLLSEKTVIKYENIVKEYEVFKNEY